MKSSIWSGRMALLPIVILFVLTPLAAIAQAGTSQGGAAQGGTSQAAPSQAAPPLAGDIVSIRAMTVVIALADGTQKTVTLKDDTLILDRQVATADQIRPGDALGVAARQDGSALTATGINIFAPEMWAVVRKGQFPMQTGEVMTNAMTAQVVQNSGGRVLTMKLDMGIAAITVPDGIPIHRLLAVSRDQLKVGLRVTIRAASDASGNLTASSVSFDQPTRG